jgi:energy-coupling factor transporter ATP-binding protein EcfA2
VEDREFFFGREKLVEEMRRRLAKQNFLAVLGPSGCGKSSLVMAGLIPAVQSREPNLQMVYLTPGSDPPAQLEAALAKLPGADNQQSAVLVVDQFEELFTLCPDGNKRRAFLDRLLTLIREQRVVITMRADFWGDCASHTALKNAMLAHQELIAPMDSAELRKAMEEQAQKVGLRFEADLSNTILDDVQGEPGAMPLLQHALLELWKRRHGRWLLSSEYRDKIGGIRHAIARTADDAYSQLTPDNQERVRDIFVRLTRLDEEVVRGEERRDTRQRVAILELVPAGSDSGITKAMVKRLADERLVVTSVNKATGAEEVEVAHEALIRYWPKLRGWLDENRTHFKLREGIREAAFEWENGKRENSFLIHRGNRLEDAEALSSDLRFPLNQLEKDYVYACAGLEGEQKQRAEKQRKVALDAFYNLTYEVPQILEGYPNTGEIRKKIVNGNLNQLGRLLEVDPDTRVLRELATNHRLLGKILIELNEMKEACLSFKNSIKFCEELIQREPKEAFWHRDCAVSHFNIAYILRRQGDQSGARYEYTAASQFAEKAVDLDASNQDWQKLLVDCKDQLAELGNRPGKGRRSKKKAL